MKHSIFNAHDVIRLTEKGKFPSKLAVLQDLNELEAKHYIKVGVE